MKLMITVLMVLTCLATATWAMAGDPQAKLTQVAGIHEKFAEQTLGNLEIPEQLLEPTSMVAEIRAVMDSTRLSEQALKEKFGMGQSSELARRMGELKRSSRMRILHIQLNYARKEGRTGLEQRILTSIEDLHRPAVPGGPRLSGRISPPPVAQMAEKPAGGPQH